MVITHVVSEIKKHYDLSNEKNIARIIKNIVDNFNTTDSSDIAFDLPMGENQQKENRRELSGRIEFSKGLTIAL